METPQYQTTRVWKETHKRLKLVAAMTGESIVELLDRLSIEELKRVQRKESRQTKREDD